MWILQTKKRNGIRKREGHRMAKLTFSGGIHPYDGKDISKDKPMK